MATLDPNFEQWLEDKINNLKERGLIKLEDEDKLGQVKQEYQSLDKMSGKPDLVSENETDVEPKLEHRILSSKMRGDYYHFVWEDDEDPTLYEEEEPARDTVLRQSQLHDDNEYAGYSDHGNVTIVSGNGVLYDKPGFDDDWEFEVDTSRHPLSASEDEERRFYKQLRGNADGQSYDQHRFSFSELANRGEDTRIELNFDPGVISDDDIIDEIDREINGDLSDEISNEVVKVHTKNPDHSLDVPDVGFRGGARRQEAIPQPSPQLTGLWNGTRLLPNYIS